MDNRKIKIRDNYRLQWEPAQKSFVLLYAEGMVKLNDSAAKILKLCDGNLTTGDITQQLKLQFPSDEVEEDIEIFLQEALSHGWIDYQ